MEMDEFIKKVISGINGTQLGSRKLNGAKIRELLYAANLTHYSLLQIRTIKKT